MRINLVKINQLILDAWRRGKRESIRGASKSFCREMSLRCGSRAERLSTTDYTLFTTKDLTR